MCVRVCGESKGAAREQQGSSKAAREQHGVVMAGAVPADDAGGFPLEGITCDGLLTFISAHGGRARCMA